MALADGLVEGEDGVVRCWWGGGADSAYRAYHDDEWGMPVTDDVRLFEKLTLEGFQSGLSWLTILRKREAFREAFAGFDFARVARFGERDVERLLADASIVRHRGKIESAINNARRAEELVEEAGSLAAFVWRFEPPPSARPARLTRETMRVGTDRARGGHCDHAVWFAELEKESVGDGARRSDATESAHAHAETGLVGDGMYRAMTRGTRVLCGQDRLRVREHDRERDRSHESDRVDRRNATTHRAPSRAKPAAPCSTSSTP